MAHGDQIGGALGAHDARHLGHGEHVALFDAAGADQVEGAPIDQHPGGGHSLPPGNLLVAHVDHAGAALVVKVRKIGIGLHILSSDAVHGAGGPAGLGPTGPVAPGLGGGGAMARRSSLPILSSRPLTLSSSAECRQGLSLPSAVRRRRLHSAQKCALTGLISPMFPCAPGRRYSRATPSCSAPGSFRQRLQHPAGRDIGRLAEQRVPGHGHQLDEAHVHRPARVNSARAGISSSLKPPISTALIFTLSKPASSAASMPCSASASCPGG